MTARFPSPPAPGPLESYAARLDAFSHSLAQGAFERISPDSLSHVSADRKLALPHFSWFDEHSDDSAPPSICTPGPAACDGQYRSAQFTPSDISAMGYTLRMNAANRVGHGGGSGGPDIVTGPDGYSKGIAGVQSTFDAAGYRPGKPHDWNWATGINSSLR